MHAQRVGDDRDTRRDASDADQAERAGVELEGPPDRLALQALAGALDVMREVLRHGEDQRQRVLGGGHHRRDRRVAHDDAGRLGVGDVDVVVADTDPRDDLGVAVPRERGGVPLPSGADEDGVGDVEPVIAAGADEIGPPVDEVAVDLGERVVDEEQGQVGRHGVLDPCRFSRLDER